MIVWILTGILFYIYILINDKKSIDEIISKVDDENLLGKEMYIFALVFFVILGPLSITYYVIKGLINRSESDNEGNQ